jgi:16S rRNA processing protein RimM
MAYNKGKLLGQITRTSGFEGTLVIRLEKSFIENIPLMESVFVEIDGRPVPFFISSYDYPGADILKLSFLDYESLHKTEEFKGCNVYFTEGDPDTGKEELPPLSGFTLIDQQQRPIGIIDSIIENPGQLLLNVVSGDGTEYLVPLHEDLILKIEKRKKVIIMEIPEGLFDLN